MERLYPEWRRSCESCIQYVYDNQGNLSRNPATSLPVLRNGLATPCEKCPKIPQSYKNRRIPVADLQKQAIELSNKNSRAIERYREWQAIGRTPDDAIAQWLSGIIHHEERQLEQEQQERIGKSLVDIIEILYARWGKQP